MVKEKGKRQEEGRAMKEEKEEEKRRMKMGKR